MLFPLACRLQLSFMACTLLAIQACFAQFLLVYLSFQMGLWLTVSPVVWFYYYYHLRRLYQKVGWHLYFESRRTVRVETPDYTYRAQIDRVNWFLYGQILLLDLKTTAGRKQTWCIPKDALSPYAQKSLWALAYCHTSIVKNR